MELMIALILLFLVLVLIVFPIWGILRIRRSAENVGALEQRIRSLESELAVLRRAGKEAVSPALETASAPAQVAARPSAPPLAPASVAAVPPPLPPSLVNPPTLPPAALPGAEPPQVPPPLPAMAPPRPIMAPAVERRTSPIAWEQFMGVKLIAWLGGLAAFLAAVYFVEYSFEHDWIPPEVRVALGFLFGAGLLVGGVVLANKQYAVTAQTLCGAGVVTLYAVTFACRSLYHFAFFGVLPTFGLMVLITAVAFLVAVRLEARVVAVLGILGGFLTPLLLSTGQDNPLGLFAYIGLLDVGLFAVAYARRWGFLVPLSAAGTLFMQVGWANSFLTSANPDVAVNICAVFNFLYLGAAVVAMRIPVARGQWTWPVAATVAMSFGFAAYMLEAAGLGAHPGWLCGLLLVADLCALGVAWVHEAAAKLHVVAGMIVFVLLGWWTVDHLRPVDLYWALGAYFVFAALHSAFPLVLERVRPGAAPVSWAHLFPPIALLLVLGPILNTPAVSMAIWPAVLLIDALAIALAWLTAAMVGVIGVLLLTLLAAGCWLTRIPSEITGIPGFLLVVGGFALLFVGVGWFFATRVKRDDAVLPADALRRQLPVFSVLLPFILLIMASLKLRAVSPDPIFGLAAALAVLSLGLTVILDVEWLPMSALAGVLGLLYSWHGHVASVSLAADLLAWTLGFYGLFLAFPFGFRKASADLRGPWWAAALAGPAVYPMVSDYVLRIWPNDVMGLLPLGFALPSLAALVVVLRLDPAEHPRRLGRLALFGGAALFFLTLVFPVQFSREWITVGWALEGAALLWLYRRVVHPGLLLVGTGLLITVFVRLALNPAVLSYHLRGDTPLFNWYLYTYGMAAACLLMGAKLLVPPRDQVGGVRLAPIMYSLGTILLFLLVNIEIADYFGRTRSALTFEFSGNFARDMSYTIAWALFAFGLLVLGIWKRSGAARFSALGLLGVTLLKLFLHDLANLGQLYRVGALLAVAVVAILASFIYQKFLPPNDSANP